MSDGESSIKLNTKECAHDGCTTPRGVSKAGHVYSYCDEHRRKYQREWARQQPKPPPVSKVSTEAQVAAGFVLEPHADGKTPQLLCIVNHANDTMTYMEVRVMSTCKTHIDKLMPGGWQALLAAQRAKGWNIVERGTPTARKAS